MKRMEDRAISGKKQTGKDTAAHAGAQELIAIIEDDVHIGNIIEESLRREGYQTCRAYSGTEALYLLADDSAGKKLDLILLDLMLPGMTGEALLPRIQDIRDIPVIVISAKVGVDDKVEALLGGAADYITKPFEIKELLARITVQLRRTQVCAKSGQPELLYKDQDGKKLAVGDLALDLELREVSSKKLADTTSVRSKPALDEDMDGKDRTVRLTRTEFAILRLLMQNAGQVFSKASILDCISADTPDCTDSSLKQHISNLRKKLQEIGAGDCIEAVWGIGFRLNP